MSKLALVFTGFCFMFLGACKSENANAKSEESKTKDRLESLRKNSESNINISALRAQALSILDHRIKEDDKSYAIVEAGCWEYAFVFDGEMSKPGDHAGEWINYKPDFTYDYGLYQEVLGAGRYHYSYDKSLILMIDNNGEFKPEEWRAQNSGDVMILVGTSTYQNNSVQMKLERLDTCPVQ